MEGDSVGFFRSIYGPNVCLISSPDAEVCVQRNGLNGFDELFGPFSTVHSETTSRDSQGQLHSVSKMKLQFTQLDEIGISENEINDRLQVTFAVNICQY